MPVWQVYKDLVLLAMQWESLSQLYKNTSHMEYSENAIRIIPKDAYLFVVKI